jgi:hypothetical protein
MAASNTRFTQNSLGQSKNPIDSDHGIYLAGPLRHRNRLHRCRLTHRFKQPPCGARSSRRLSKRGGPVGMDATTIGRLDCSAA